MASNDASDGFWDTELSQLGVVGFVYMEEKEVYVGKVTCDDRRDIVAIDLVEDEVEVYFDCGYFASDERYE